MNADCPKHQQPLILFCNEPKCQVSICALCIPESHPLHNVVKAESKIEQGKKVLQESATNARQLCKKYVDDCDQLDLAIKRLHTMGNEAIEKVNEEKMILEGNFKSNIQHYARGLCNKIKASMATEEARLFKEKERINTSKKKMNSLVQNWETITNPQMILSEADSATKRISDISDQIKGMSFNEFSIPNFAKGSMEGVAVEKYFGSVSTENFPVRLPQTVTQRGTLEFPEEPTTGQDTCPIKEVNLQMSWDIKVSRDVDLDRRLPWTIRKRIGIKHMCAVGDKIVVYKQNFEQGTLKGSLTGYSINGDILCSSREGHPSLGGVREVTHMVEVIPRNSKRSYLITSHKESNELNIWQLDDKRIHQGDNDAGFFGGGIVGGYPEWLCPAGRGALYLVSGNSPHQSVQMFGVVASKTQDAKKERAQISTKSHKSREIGIADIIGLACVKSPSKEDILVFSSHYDGGALVAKMASNLQTLWRIGQPPSCDFIDVTSMSVDPKQNLLYLVHKDIGNGSCNSLLVYDAEQARVSQIDDYLNDEDEDENEEEDDSEDSYSEDIYKELESVTLCQDRLIVKVRRLEDISVHVYTLKHTK